MKLSNNKGSASVWVISLVAVLAIAIAGFFILQSNDDSSDTTGSVDSSAPESTAQESTANQQDADEPENIESTGTVITSGDSDFGTMLFDGDGQAIYIWEVEESSTAECYDDCADAWPPVLSDGAPLAMGDVKNDLLGTTERTDGTTQVTYNDHPLYYYAHEDAGEVKCHNISTHGGLWWVIQPSGIRAD